MAHDREKQSRMAPAARLAMSAGLAVLMLLWGAELLHLPSAGAAARKASFCNRTAKAAFKACRSEARDDYWIAVGNCNNLPDADDRKECLRDAKQELKDAIEECRDQREARLEICAELGPDPYDPQLDPENFEAGAPSEPNPYFPLVPKTVWNYKNKFAGETNIVEVTTDTKDIEYPADSGNVFTCVVVHDQVMVDGKVTEDTLDYYAQDVHGNVWYFGELSQEFEDGELVSLEGSWKAGVDGAKPGILVEAAPEVGDIYRQEFFLGDAEDMAEVVALDAAASVPAGDYTNVLQTRDFTPLEPDVEEYKYYAPNVGVVLEENPETGERNELVSVITTP